MTARKDGWLAQSDFDPHNLSKSVCFLGLVVRPITVSREVRNTARSHCWSRVEIYEIVDSWLESIISNIVRMEPCTRADGHVWELAAEPHHDNWVASLSSAATQLNWAWIESIWPQYWLLLRKATFDFYCKFTRGYAKGEHWSLSTPSTPKLNANLKTPFSAEPTLLTLRICLQKRQNSGR